MDHVVTVPAGAEFPLKTGGDFVYVKYATHPVRILVEGDPVTMEAGDKWRVAGGFQQLTLDNPDQEQECLVRLTIGEGDYNRQIIQGQITVNPGIRTADGEFVEDTRKTLNLITHITESVQKRVEAQETIETINAAPPTENVYGLTFLPGNQALIKGPGTTPYLWHVVDLDEGTMKQVGGAQFTDPPVKWEPYREDGGAYIREWDENGQVAAWLEPHAEAQWAVFSHGANGHLDWKSKRLYLPKIWQDKEKTPNTANEYEPVGPFRLGYIVYDAETLIPIDHWNGKVEYSQINPDPKGDNAGLHAIAVVHGFVFIRQPTEVVVMDHTTGDLVKRIDEKNYNTVRDFQPVFNEREQTWRLHLFDGASEPNVINARTLAVESGQWALNVSNDMFALALAGATGQGTPENNAAWVLESGQLQDLQKWALQEHVITVRGFVQTKENPLLKPPEKQKTTAKVKTRPGPGGTTYVAGEIIRAALELYTGQTMPENYLDYVYSVEAENLNFQAPAEINGGGMSFAGVGFEDNFTGFFPQTLRITVREGAI